MAVAENIDMIEMWFRVLGRDMMIPKKVPMTEKTTVQMLAALWSPKVWMIRVKVRVWKPINMMLLQCRRDQQAATNTQRDD